MTTKTKDIEKVEINSDMARSLILWNDEVSTFDFVIEKLIEICDHTYPQATQCVLIIHNKGKLDVKKGSYDEVKAMKDKFISYGIQATIK